MKKLLFTTLLTTAYFAAEAQWTDNESSITTMGAMLGLGLTILKQTICKRNHIG